MSTVVWRTTIMNAIFKNKGTRKLAEFYRGISIVYLMAKIFDIILLNRFKKWFVPSDLQTAYQEEMSRSHLSAALSNFVCTQSETKTVHH